MKTSKLLIESSSNTLNKEEVARVRQQARLLCEYPTVCHRKILELCNTIDNLRSTKAFATSDEAARPPLLNGTQLECDCEELRPDGTCAKCERINQRIASLIAEREARWLPIETYPKFGRVVLLFAWCDAEHSNWKKHTGHYNDVLEAWIWNGEVVGENDLQPSHWMPLPEPPEPKG